MKNIEIMKSVRFMEEDGLLKKVNDAVLTTETLFPEMRVEEITPLFAVLKPALPTAKKTKTVVLFQNSDYKILSCEEVVYVDWNPDKLVKKMPYFYYNVTTPPPLIIQKDDEYIQLNLSSGERTKLGSYRLQHLFISPTTQNNATVSYYCDKKLRQMQIKSFEDNGEVCAFKLMDGTYRFLGHGQCIKYINKDILYYCLNDKIYRYYVRVAAADEDKLAVYKLSLNISADLVCQSWSNAVLVEHGQTERRLIGFNPDGTQNILCQADKKDLVLKLARGCVVDKGTDTMWTWNYGVLDYTPKKVEPDQSGPTAEPEKLPKKKSWWQRLLGR